jgi:hypothetical protein
LVSEVMERYQISADALEKLCAQFDLPIIGTGEERFILMYKPNVFEHPQTKKKSMQINLFELIGLNEAMRRCFMNDYSGKSWGWHRLVWRLPVSVLRVLELVYMSVASFFYSPRNALSILRSKWKTRKASKKLDFDDTRVSSCFTKQQIKELAQWIRTYYSSCLWQKGDILLVDNRKVMHAGMPGAGPRLVRALIANPLEMQYSFLSSGLIDCRERDGETLGFYMSQKKH